ncbi:hypothetical protein [Streptomyces sp. NPDC096153]|uniref:hypothetical protein n=1 Tax=Streptomyces sp. NPDC096153 TaxID=3155548 RepID=UPI00331FE24C
MTAHEHVRVPCPPRFAEALRALGPEVDVRRFPDATRAGTSRPCELYESAARHGRLVVLRWD